MGERASVGSVVKQVCQAVFRARERRQQKIAVGG